MLETNPNPKRKSKQEYSVSAAVLEDLRGAHPIVPLLARFRKLSHFENNSGDLKSFAPSWARSGPGGICRLRPTFQQTNVETGRVVTENPNLQCMPRQWPENPQPGELVLNPRAGFVASRGHVLLSADYRQARRLPAPTVRAGCSLDSCTAQARALRGPAPPHVRTHFPRAQLELRIMAHFSGDRNLLAAFRGGTERGHDPFIQLAAQWMRKPAAQVTADNRRWAKAITYGMLYGKGPRSIAKDIEDTEERARELMHQFDRAYPQLADWRKRVRPPSAGGRGNYDIISPAARAGAAPSHSARAPSCVASGECLSSARDASVAVLRFLPDVRCTVVTAGDPQAVAECKKRLGGPNNQPYVETIAGRRRYLPAIVTWGNTQAVRCSCASLFHVWSVEGHVGCPRSSGAEAPQAAKAGFRGCAQ